MLGPADERGLKRAPVPRADPAVHRILDALIRRRAAVLGALVVEPVVEHVVENERLRVEQ